MGYCELFDCPSTAIPIEQPFPKYLVVGLSDLPTRSTNTSAWPDVSGHPRGHAEELWLDGLTSCWPDAPSASWRAARGWPPTRALTSSPLALADLVPRRRPGTTKGAAPTAPTAAAAAAGPSGSAAAAAPSASAAAAPGPDGARSAPHPAQMVQGRPRRPRAATDPWRWPHRRVHRTAAARAGQAHTLPSAQG